MHETYLPKSIQLKSLMQEAELRDKDNVVAGGVSAFGISPKDQTAETADINDFSLHLQQERRKIEEQLEHIETETKNK